MVIWTEVCIICWLVTSICKLLSRNTIQEPTFERIIVLYRYRTDLKSTEFRQRYQIIAIGPESYPHFIQMS